MANISTHPPLPPKPNYPPPVHRDVRKQREGDVWMLAIVIRIVCAFTLSTFFQPDEYYQTLEPAWRVAFGQDSGAWITWEWHHGLRSSIHPLILAIVYWLVNSLSWTMGLPTTFRSQMLLVAPRLSHGLLAAMLDYSTWRLAERIFGKSSKESTAAIFMVLFSPWHWFAGTRALTNGLEASLTAVALTYWPWSWLTRDAKAPERRQEAVDVKFSICFAAVATVLRPTNLLIWGLLSLVTFAYASMQEIMAFVQDASIIGTVVLALCNGLDRVYYGEWCFPAARFLNYNLTQDLAVFYGQNRFDYYFTEGLPILLTVAMPFALAGIATCYISPHTPNSRTRSPKAAAPVMNPAPALIALAVAALGYTIALSLISHKEVRFLYPLLPILLVLASRPLTAFFDPFPWPNTMGKRALILLLTTVSVVFTVYITYIHNRGLISVLAYLRSQFIAINADALVLGTAAATPKSLLSWLFGGSAASTSLLHPLSAAFLMPCHSTPWRSHLVHPEIRAWALTCEPPIGLVGAAREAYTDEADVFYADPRAWLRANMDMGTLPTVRQGASPQPWDADVDWRAGDMRDLSVQATRPWPRHLVFFAQLEVDVRAVIGDVGSGMETRYRECWRGFNTHWHDDWRRQGDVVVYCVDGSVDIQPMVEAYRENLAAANAKRREENPNRLMI